MFIYLCRHASRYTSPERSIDRDNDDHLTQQNENLLHYIEGWISVAKQLLKQEEEEEEQWMIDETHFPARDRTNENLLCQFQVRHCHSRFTQCSL